MNREEFKAFCETGGLKHSNDLGLSYNANQEVVKENLSSCVLKVAIETVKMGNTKSQTLSSFIIPLGFITEKEGRELLEEVKTILSGESV